MVLYRATRWAGISPKVRASLPATGVALSGIAFAVLNTWNLCSPGWCASYGFPLQYKGWSDAQVIFNGVNLGITPFSPTALAVDVAIACLVAGAVFQLLRKSAAHVSRESAFESVASGSAPPNSR
jgi:hypothetical protein